MEAGRWMAAVGAAGVALALAGTPAVAEIRVGVATVSGDIDKLMIRRLFRRNAPALERCYRAQARRAPDLGSAVATSKLVVMPDGMVQTATVDLEPSHPANAAIARCMAERIKRFRFPAARGGGLVQIRYPIQLSRDDRAPGDAPACVAAAICPLVPGSVACCSGTSGAGTGKKVQVAADPILEQLRAAMRRGAPPERPPLPPAPPSAPQPVSRSGNWFELPETPISFATGSADLGDDARATLDEIAAKLSAFPIDVPVTLTGHATAGEPNQLAIDRAIAARDYLIAQGVPYGSLIPRAVRSPHRTVEIAGKAWHRGPTGGRRIIPRRTKRDVKPWGAR